MILNHFLTMSYALGGPTNMKEVDIVLAWRKNPLPDLLFQVFRATMACDHELVLFFSLTLQNKRKIIT